MRPKGRIRYPHPLSFFDPEVALHLTKLIMTPELQNIPWHTNILRETNILSIAPVSLDHLTYYKVLFLLQPTFYNISTLQGKHNHYVQLGFHPISSHSI